MPIISFKAPFSHRLKRAWQLLWADGYMVVVFRRDKDLFDTTVDATMSEQVSALNQLVENVAAFQEADAAVEELKNSLNL